MLIKDVKAAVNFLPTLLANQRHAYRQKKRELTFPFRRYNKKLNCIFIHVPKVAGTSVLAGLGNGQIYGRDHLPWYVYFTANPTFYSQAFKFAFVRNPWSRTYSAYKYLLHGGNNTTDGSTAKALASYGTFDRFVIEGLGAGLFRNHLLFLPQSFFVLNGDGQIAVDYLGRYETIGKDYNVIADRLKLTQPLSVRNPSKNEKENCSDVYRLSESVQVVREIYAQDIAMFNYSFEKLRNDTVL